MYCPSVDCLHLRANGSLCCWTDAGNRKVLHRYDPRVDYAKQVYAGPQFDLIRKKISVGQFPFPDYCSKCFCLQYGKKLIHKKNRPIRTFTVEPSLFCALNCPACISKNERKDTLPADYFLHATVFKKVLEDLKKGAIGIDLIDFQGNGEPLANKKTFEMIRCARDLYPTTHIVLYTNANFKFHPDCVRSGLSTIVFSIDGCDQKSYDRYRRNGDFGVAFDFMKSCCAEAKKFSLPIRTVWKYILFAHNDSNDHLLQTAAMAKEIGIDELQFIITCRGPVSQRIVDARVVKSILQKRMNASISRYICFPEKSFFLVENFIELLKERNLFIWLRMIVRFSRKCVRTVSKKGSDRRRDGKCFIVKVNYFKPNQSDIKRGICLAYSLQKKKNPIAAHYITHIRSMITGSVVRGLDERYSKFLAMRDKP